MREEVFARGVKAAVGAPKIVDERRNDTVVHVARYDKVEISEKWRDSGVIEIDGGVDDGDFCLMGWQVV